MGIKKENLFIFGRSIGTGPATLLASLFKPAGLIIMSPYTSIKAVTAHVTNKFFSYLIATHFNNKEAIKNVTSPVLFIHGMKDTLIPSAHSEELYETLLKQSENK